MRKIKVILNPNAGKGYGRKIAPHIEQTLRTLQLPFELEKTRARGDAIALAHQAALDGYETIVAVGGDGTTHEVVNGIMSAVNGYPAGNLACIPAGSGNDFAVMNGTPTDVEEACHAIAQGHTQLVDLGRVTIDGKIQRYFDNAVGIGFDALVTKETYRMKYLRGIALYLPAVLKTIFLTMQPPHVELVLDGEPRELDALMLVVCNGPREGGAFHLAPDALYDDGWFNLVIARKVPRLEMLRMVPLFLRGTHLSHPAVSTLKAKQIEVRSDEPLHIHVDGEILCDYAHHVKIEMIPKAMRMITRF